MLDFLLRPSGIMYRPVKLEGEWYKNASGAMLGTLKGDKSVALIPGKFSGYNYKDPESGKLIHITKKNVKDIDEGAICFYTQFPLRSVGTQDLLSYVCTVAASYRQGLRRDGRCGSFRHSGRNGHTALL